MRLSIDVKPIWITLIPSVLVVVDALLIGVMAWRITALFHHESIGILWFLVGIERAILFVALFLIGSLVKITMRALDLGIEVVKNNSEESRRMGEDKKLNESEEKQRSHEIKLAEIGNVIKVEVADVRMLRG